MTKTIAKRRGIDDVAAEILDILDRPDPKEAVRSAAQAVAEARDAGDGGLRQEYLREAQRRLRRIDPRRYRRELQELQGQVLALQGRGRDTQIAHVTPGEWVIPAWAQTPEMAAYLASLARTAGVDPKTFEVGSPRAKVNPRTGHQEFNEEIEGITTAAPRDDGHDQEPQSGEQIEEIVVTAKAPRPLHTIPLEFQPTTPMNVMSSESPEFILMPKGVSLEANMAEAAKHPLNPFWLRDQVRNKARWDFKQSGPFEKFGNFHYGAVGAAAGIPDEVLLRGAGWAQKSAGTSKPEHGRWWGSAPYGDDPTDQDMIRKGINYAKGTK